METIAGVGRLTCRDRHDTCTLGRRCFEDKVGAVGVGLADGLGDDIAKGDIAVGTTAVTIEVATLF